jgi:hypothetical protein
MGQILEVRLEDGSTAAIDASLISGVSLTGVSATAAALVADTGYAPPPGGGAFVKFMVEVYDPTANLNAGAEWNVSLRKSAAGVLAIAASAQVGANLGDAALTADVVTTFTVSADDTLVLNVAVGAYPNACEVVATLSNGATT